MAKSRRLRRSRKLRSKSKRRMTKRSMSKRRMAKRSMSKRGGLTCYDEKGWPDRNGYYNSNGTRNENCPIGGETGLPAYEPSSWGKKRGYGDDY